MNENVVTTSGSREFHYHGKPERDHFKITGKVHPSRMVRLPGSIGIQGYFVDQNTALKAADMESELKSIHTRQTSDPSLRSRYDEIYENHYRPLMVTARNTYSPTNRFVMNRIGFDIIVVDPQRSSEPEMINALDQQTGYESHSFNGGIHNVLTPRLLSNTHYIGEAASLADRPYWLVAKMNGREI